MTITPAAWAELLADAVADYLSDYHGEVEVVIGNPNVGGDYRRCDLTVVVDFGDLYATTEPWPTPTLETASRPRSSDEAACEFTVGVRTCVPTVSEQGAPPSEDERAESVELLGRLGMDLAAALTCAATTWRSEAKGRVFVDRVTPLAKEGGIAGWECRVVCPTCITCGA